jgi:hypothetical protein
MTIQDETNLPTANDTGERQAADVAKQAGGEVASTVADGALEMTSEAADQVKVVAGEAKAQLEDLFGRARDEARQQADDRTQQAARRLRTFSEEIEALAEGRPSEAGSLLTYLREAEDRAQNLAARLERGGPDAVANDLKQFARRRPGLYLGTAVAAGFIVGRAVRAGAMSAGKDTAPTAMVGPDGSSARPVTQQEADSLPSGSSDVGVLTEPTPATPPSIPSAGGVVP